MAKQDTETVHYLSVKDGCHKIGLFLVLTFLVPHLVGYLNLNLI